MVKRIFVTLMFLSTGLSQNIWAAAYAEFDRQKINLNESVQLTISVDSTNVFGEPDADILNKHFTVLSRNKSSNHSIINGQSTSKTSWNYQLSAKQAGIINLPEISIGSEKTQATNLVVAPIKTASTNDSDTLSAVFIETELSKKTAFVQEQVLLTIRINDSVGLQDISLQEMKVDNAFIKEISNKSYTREISGKPFRTYEIRYAVFAQHSGELTIPASLITGTVVDNSRRAGFSFRNLGRPIQIKGDQQTINIQAPAQTNSSTWLPAKNLQLHESWSQDLKKLRSGDSITRSIVITATGLSGEQLPALATNAVSGVKFYHDQAEVTESIVANDIVGQRTETQTLVLTQSADIQLPAISIDWFNTATGKTETARLDAINIHVGANPELQKVANNSPEKTTASMTAKPVANTTGLNNILKQNESLQQLRLWQTSSFIGIFCSAVLLFLLLRSKRQNMPKTVHRTIESSEAAERALQQACKSRSARDIHRACLAFAKTLWPTQTIHSLADIKRCAASADLQHLLDALDQHLARGEDFKQADVLFDALKKLAREEEKPSALKDLYPS